MMTPGCPLGEWYVAVYGSVNPLVREINLRGNIARWSTSEMEPHPIAKGSCQCRPAPGLQPKSQYISKSGSRYSLLVEKRAKHFFLDTV
ncbi:uncharacterized protein TNCV_2147341 [Trichonephila clavipes]|uniref:Uncharacterized protein n=1 Tax=Trichonephila clavipes TaxID=2585209 RepID=A0A8X6SXM8_TRICX|nr:uncharacterized protein TNCV_2147341 [Trichonephila clavipes]